MLRVDPRDEADLLWYFNDAAGEIRALRSTWPQEARANAERSSSGTGVVLRQGQVHVPSSQLHPQPRGIDGRAIAAVTLEKRIRRQLAAAGPDAELALQLRYREVLTPSRAVFGAGDSDRMRRTLDAASSKDKVQRERARLTAINQRARPERGPGSLAHITAAAFIAYAGARSTLPIERWVDRLGQRLAAGGATEAERTLQREITRQADALVLRAWQAYRRAPGRVPEAVRRRAAVRMAVAL